MVPLAFADLAPFTSPVPVLWVLCLTGVPVKPLRPSEGIQQGRWDEVWRCVVAAKCRSKEGSSSFTALVLMESVEDGVNRGVAAIVLDRACLEHFSVAQGELEGMMQFQQMALKASVFADCCDAVSHVLQERHPVAERVSCCVFASPDDEVFGSLGCIPSAPDASCAEGLNLCVKVFGGPCSWAQPQEVVRLTRLIAMFEQRYGRPVVTSLGPTRLRLSQCLLAQDGLRLLSARARASGKVPRCAFFLNFDGMALDDKVLRLVHHFIVEVMYVEKRRETPRHHVTVCCSDQKGCVTALDLEDLRSTLRRKHKKDGKVLGITYAVLEPEWKCLLQLKRDITPNRSIRLQASFSMDVSDGGSDALEQFTAHIVRWQLEELAKVK